MNCMNIYSMTPRYLLIRAGLVGMLALSGISNTAQSAGQAHTANNGFSGHSSASWPAKPGAYPVIGARAKPTIKEGVFEFKDLNANGKLDRYEDWRLPVHVRIDDLVTQMTLEEKVGMLLIDTLNADAYGKTSDQHKQYIQGEKMTRFIFRNLVTTEEQVNREKVGRSGPDLTPFEAAQYMNAVQELSESTRLGIPALFKSNARNHFASDARAGINNSSGAFSEWPKEAGLSATRDMDLIADFADIMRQEWTAIGLRGMYGYMADLSTEPRWYRVHETFTEDADLAADIMSTLVSNLQGEQINSDSVVLTMKHFPGGGPQFLGLDPHYIAGQHQSYPAGLFQYHLKPFRAAIDAGVAALMPYYGIAGGGTFSLNNPDITDLDAGGVDLIDLVSDRVKDTVRVPDNTYSTSVGTPPGNVGMAFSEGILSDLLRGELGYDGVINSDTGIIGEPNENKTDYEVMQNNRAWGLQDSTKEDQLRTAIEAGADVLSGFHNNDEVRFLVEAGMVSEGRVDESVKRLLKVQFDLGLFENPYVDAERAAELVGNQAFMEKAQLAQRKSIVLLKNEDAAKRAVLPLPLETENGPAKVYTLGMDPGIVASYGYEVTAGDLGGVRPSAAESDYALIRVLVNNEGAEPMLVFGGANFDEVDVLDFTGMAEAQSWKITPSLADIQAVMSEIGADKTVLSIYFRQPYVLDEVSGLKNAGAILATFGVRDEALMDVLVGEFNPAGKLPFALANSAEAIIEQDSDAPGYDEEQTLYPFGFGISY